mgnify:FL=1
MRKVVHIIIFNLSMFILLMIGIQNSSDRRKVNFIIGETVNLPVSFIIGTFFISGSLSASLLKIDLDTKN